MILVNCLSMSVLVLHLPPFINVSISIKVWIKILLHITKKNRKRQCSLVLSLADHQEFSKAYKSYFWGIAGFFIIENIVAQTAPKLITPNFKEKLWKQSLTTMTNILKEKIRECDDTNILSDLKEFLQGFCHTMKSYGYSLDSFFEFVKVSTKERFIIVVTAVINNLFKKKFEEDNFIPVMVRHNDREIKETLSIIVKEIMQNKSSETLSFPFSKMVPNCLNTFKQFLTACLHMFARHGVLEQGMDQRIIKTTESLIRSMNSSYVNTVAAQSLSVGQAAVAYINMNFLQKMIFIFENLVSSQICNSVKLNVKESFETAIKNLEAKVFEILEKNVVTNMRKARDNIVWTPEKADKSPKQHIIVLVEYVSNTLPQEISGLSEDFCLKIYGKYYEVLLQQFMELFMSAVQFNRNCARGFLIDLLALEEAAKRCPLPGVIDSFEEVKQLFTLLTV